MYSTRLFCFQAIERKLASVVFLYFFVFFTSRHERRRRRMCLAVVAERKEVQCAKMNPLQWIFCGSSSRKYGKHFSTVHVHVRVHHVCFDSWCSSFLGNITVHGCPVKGSRLREDQAVSSKFLRPLFRYGKFFSTVQSCTFFNCTCTRFCSEEC